MSLRILLIEDEPGLVITISDLLAAEGYEVDSAADGEAGLGQFDVGTARAVAPIAELVSWLAPLVRTGGHAVLFKGSSYAEELSAWDAELRAAAGAPAWRQVEVIPVADRHLYFAILERLP